MKEHYITCPKCGEYLIIPEDYDEGKVECSKCNHKFYITSTTFSTPSEQSIEVEDNGQHIESIPYHHTSIEYLTCFQGFNWIFILFTTIVGLIFINDRQVYFITVIGVNILVVFFNVVMQALKDLIKQHDHIIDLLSNRSNRQQILLEIMQFQIAN